MSFTEVELIVVHRSLRAQDCLERSLVLSAMGIDHAVQRGWWGWCLLVPQPDADAACEQLRLYEQENHTAPPGGRSTSRRGGVKTGVLVYAAILLLFYLFQGTREFGIDWTSTGRIDVAAIRAGELWRTVTALTLHRDVAHLASNLGFGSVFGVLLARQLGGGVAWLLILACGAIGNWMNALVQRPTHLALGASTAVFATLGLLAAYFWASERLDGAGWARRWIPVVGGLWVLAWLGTGDARTDVVAHLTGFVAGFLAGLLLGRRPPPERYDPALQWAAGAAAVGCVAGAWGLALG